MVKLVSYQKTILHLQIKLLITPFANSLDQWHDLQDEMQFHDRKLFAVHSMRFM